MLIVLAYHPSHFSPYIGGARAAPAVAARGVDRAGGATTPLPSSITMGSYWSREKGPQAGTREGTVRAAANFCARHEQLPDRRKRASPIVLLQAIA